MVNAIEPAWTRGQGDDDDELGRNENATQIDALSVAALALSLAQHTAAARGAPNLQATGFAPGFKITLCTCIW
jgi:hypothetical protein